MSSLRHSMNSPLRCILLATFATFCIENTLAAPLWDELDANDRAKLEQGETVVHSRDISGEAWPELTLYRLVDAPPSVVAELFSDYASAPSYTPGMLGAEVVNEPEPNVKDVRYTVRVPVLSRISYTVRNRFVEKNGSYEVLWNLLESPMASESTGSLLIEPHDGKSLLRYRNHVTPSIPMAGALKNQARKEAVTTVEAIAEESKKRAGR